MSQYSELPVFKASYDLLLAIFQFTKNFTRDYKYTVGESIKKETIELINGIYRANATKEKIHMIEKARENVEVIRLYIRLMKDLKQISLDKFVSINEKVENVSKQLTGWQKSQKAK